LRGPGYKNCAHFFSQWQGMVYEETKFLKKTPPSQFNTAAQSSKMPNFGEKWYI
jgi:hypothetical protein